MTGTDESAMLLRYLHRGREAILWKLDGLSEYDVRRPMTPTGTNLLGLVKHLACVEFGYFADTFGRPREAPLPWDGNDPMADMWVAADETRDDVVGLYRRAWAVADATVAELPLDAPGRVPWWPAERAGTTLRRILVHVIEETARHAGHADIIRETLDGAVGRSAEVPNLAELESWPQYVDRLERLAREGQDRATRGAAGADGAGGSGGAGDHGAHHE